ncbi:hypothetical protein NQ314_007381 [Rhamnusium bicolor]|uniref:Uncharacterized protein n=1 Tax=Rhamnusium bicolor TaxID=1586634 RepID=A0AAV8YNY3_9CUCU|nr:hypothetical protein NQ314_007381 [Rhamnusium bicolor]
MFCAYEFKSHYRKENNNSRPYILIYIFLADYIHICKRNDVHVAKCIRESIEIIRPKLKNGITELGVPGLEPLRIDEIEIFRGDDSSNFKAVLKNVDVSGASEFKITKLKLDVDKNTYRIGVRFPGLDLTGDYDINARVLVAPIKGSGKFYANVSKYNV